MRRLINKLKYWFINWLRKMAIKKLNLLDPNKYTIVKIDDGCNLFSQGIIFENDKSLDDFIKNE